MKKIKRLFFEESISVNNLYEALKFTIRHHKDGVQQTKFMENYKENILELNYELVNKIWNPSKYTIFTKFNSHKMRIIESPAYRDRIVHNAIIRVVEPYIDEKFIYHSYSCRIGKGNIRAVKQVYNIVNSISKSHKLYALQCDVHHFFPSIDIDILFKEWERMVIDKEYLELLRIASIRPYDINNPNTGIPIGARPSQLHANVYMNPLDHYICEGLGYGDRYVRYADDFILIDYDKNKLKEDFKKIDEFINTRLSLTLNSKSRVYPVDIPNGIDFCGYHIFRDHMLPRRKVVKNFLNKFEKYINLKEKEKLIQVYGSLYGYLSHCDSYRLLNNIKDDIYNNGFDRLTKLK